MKSYNNMYKCLDKYMVRTPLLPVDMYFKIDKESRDKVVFFENDDRVQEAIITTSTSLYNSIIKPYRKEKDRNQIESSLLKYLIRMSTRTTPYGLLSGVGLGNFGTTTMIHLEDLSKGTKYMRADMDWIFRLLGKIESDDNILKELKVYKNNSLEENGDRLDNVYLSNYGQSNTENSKFNASIIFSKKVKDTMKLSENGIKVKDLILELNPENKYDCYTIFKFLKQLIKNEYLLTELRTPLINTDTMKYIIEKLKHIEFAESICKDLECIYTDINKYNETEIGQGQKEYLNILSKMKKVCECENYLQIDLKLNDEVCTLNKNIKKDVEKLVDVLLKISKSDYQPTHLEQFANEFSEKYGIYREVRLLEVLDRDKGLGYPAGYRFSMKNITNSSVEVKSSERRYKEIIDKKLNDVVNKKSEDICLLDNDLDYICEDSKQNWDKDNLPNSLDINVFIKSKSLESVDNGDYELFIGPNYGSSFAGKMFGRFAYMFENNLSDMFEKIDSTVKAFNQDTILVEITQLPSSGRSANVCKNYNEREYELCIATNASNNCEQINIEDVYVGIDESNKFYFKSKKLNKKIIFTSNHMLNVLSGDNTYRFMREVSQESNIDIFSSVYGTEINNLNFIPRIRYKNIIISPAMWIVHKRSIKTNKFEEKERIIDINRFLKENNVPRYVYIGENDNRIVIDIKNEAHLHELLKIIDKVDECTYIKELDFSIDNVWFEDGKGDKYISEFILPLVLNKDFIKTTAKKEEVIETKSNISKNKNLINTYSSNRVNGLFEDWIYFKFYGVESRIEEFLGYDLIELITNLKNENIIDKFFYIRYSDPQNHVRFRVKLSEIDRREDLIKIMNDFIKREFNKGIISNVNVDTYFKEIERYGGIDVFDLVEDVFCADSLVVMNLMNLKSEKQCELDDITVACINIVHIMQSFGITFEDQNKLFQSIYNQKDGRDIFRKKYQNLKEYCDEYNDWENLKNIRNGELIYNVLKIREDVMKEYWKSINEYDERGRLTNSKEDILLSIIHMFCNRFLKTRSDEDLAMRLVRHTLHSLEYKKKIKEESYAGN